MMPESENEQNIEDGPDTIDDDDDGDIQEEVGDVPNYDNELGEDEDD
jgi:hypothetical protein